MAICTRLEKCPFYQGKMSADEGLGAMYKKTYCECDNSKCARNMVATACGPDKVPLNLYPNMVSKAEKIIKENS